MRSIVLAIVDFLPHLGKWKPTVIADSPCHFIFASRTLYSHPVTFSLNLIIDIIQYVLYSANLSFLIYDLRLRILFHKERNVIHQTICHSIVRYYSSHTNHDDLMNALLINLSHR